MALLTNLSAIMEHGLGEDIQPILKWGLLSPLQRGKVVDIDVDSNFCPSCRRMARLDQNSDEYLVWYENHKKVGTAGRISINLLLPWRQILL